MKRGHSQNTIKNSNESVESQDMDPNNGQFINEILKKTGRYHPDSTRINKKGQFGFTNAEDDLPVKSENCLEDVESHTSEDLSIGRSEARVTNNRTRNNETKSHIEIEDTEMQQRLVERHSRRSEGFSHIDHLNHEMIVPEDMKSTMHILDKSIISQFDTIS